MKSISDKIITSLGVASIGIGLIGGPLMLTLSAKDVKREANAELTKPYKTYTVEGKVTGETFVPPGLLRPPSYTLSIKDKEGNIKTITFIKKTEQYNAMINTGDNVRFTAIATNKQNYDNLEKDSFLEQRVYNDLALGELNYNPSWKLEIID